MTDIETADSVAAWLAETDDCDGDCEVCPEFGLCDEDLDDAGD